MLNYDAAVSDPGKQPLGNNWQINARRDPPLCATSPAVKHALNTGILADGLRPIDLDIDDPEKARRCRALAISILGDAPTRTRQGSPRSLMLYRAAAGEPVKRTLTGRGHTKELGCKIEVLGHGQQFVAFGRHPNGADLEWYPEPPGGELREALPAVGEDDIQAFLEACAPLLDAPVPAKPNGHDHVPGEPQADSLRIAAALASIANGGAADWEAWNRVGMAVWRATGGSNAGWEAFNAWSARNQAYNLEVTRARWDHYVTSPPTLIGAGTIFHMAAEAEQRKAEARHHRQSNVKGHIKLRPTAKLASNQPPLTPALRQQGNPFDDPAKDSPEGIQDDLNLPIIRLKAGALHLITTEAEAAIVEAGVPIFQRGPNLVRPAVWEVPATQGRTAHAAGLGTLKSPAIIDVLSAVASFQRYDKRTRSYVRTNPPTQIADILLSRYGLWEVPSIAGVITTPTLRSDGSILSAPGYDPVTRLYHAVDPVLKLDPVVHNPTRTDAEASLDQLRGLLVDFPFVVIKAEGKPDRCLRALLPYPR